MYFDQLLAAARTQKLVETLIFALLAKWCGTSHFQRIFLVYLQLLFGTLNNFISNKGVMCVENFMPPANGASQGYYLARCP